jgi:excisionase family DNA binding protein
MNLIVDGELINGLLSLDEIARNPAMLAHQPPHEIKETKIAAAAALAALNAAEADCAPASGNPAAPAERLLNAAEAASYLGVRESFVRVKAREGDLLSVPVGRYVRFERKALDDFARRRK